MKHLASRKADFYIVLFSLLFLVLVTGRVHSQADIPRKTMAITYPLNEEVIVPFRGTTRFPRMKGEAKVKRTSKNGTEIELSVSKMPRPFELGRGYATYVLWAISPDGQIDNLGEIKRRGFFEFDSKISVTTPLQTFALIVTAEPHFLVKRPSQEIMLENINPYTLSGKTISTMPAIEYFGNSSDYFRDARTPEIAEVDYSKTPSTILQAKQAIALARFAGAERDAQSELAEAQTLLDSAEQAWKAGRSESEVDIVARRAISTAVKAESESYIRQQARQQRNEKARTDAELKAAEDKYAQAQAEIAELKRQLADEIRARELVERDTANFDKQVRDLREENNRLREENARLKLELGDAKNKLAAAEQEKQAAISEKEKSEKIAQLKSNEPQLIQQLKQFGTVTTNERGIVLTLAENFWSGVRSTAFSPAAARRLSALASLLAKNPDYKIQIEAHTDSAGDPTELEQFTQQRAEALAERLFSFGVQGNRLAAKGLGSSFPVASNNTAAGKARNRRTQLILIPNI
ncbi:MAG TPA: OmpA family protein [Pyrinomonadaceae bacterium]|nr:OmpA family protein [Pyrinomonadaceae bacterium]